MTALRHIAPWVLGSVIVGRCKRLGRDHVLCQEPEEERVPA